MKKLSLAVLLFILACATPSPEKILEDKKLFELGNTMFAKERYADAASYYESLKNRFPESPYATESELKLADSHFQDKEHEVAQVEYESFRSLHPTHEKIPYVYLQIGKCQMLQAPKSVQKDQAQTEAALQTFTELQSRWPGSPEAEESKKSRDRAEEKLAGKQLYVAKFYIGQKKYFPALKRLENLDNDHTPQDIRREALYRLGLVHLKMNNPDIAKQTFEKLVSQNINDSYDKKAKRKLSSL